jgi:prefoldin subunit 5
MPKQNDDERRHKEVIERLEEIDSSLSGIQTTLTSIDEHLEAIRKIAREFERPT